MDKTGKICMLATTLILLTSMLLNVYCIKFSAAYDPLFAFWLPVLVAGLLTFYATITSDSRFPLIMTILFSLSLHLVQMVRQPTGMVWNHDSIFALQILNHVEKSGSWEFGYGTSSAYEYSYYPLFFLLMSMLSSVSSISSLLIVKYLMAFLNILTLMTFYILVGELFGLDNKSKNLIVFMFSLNPKFHGFDSYSVMESYAMIFYPLILLYASGLRSFGRIKRSYVAIVVLLLIVTSMSHHFTSYLVIISLLGPPLILYFRSKVFKGNLRLCMLALTSTSMWLSFIAYHTFVSHTKILEGVQSHLTIIHTLVGYVPGPASALSYYPSELSKQITLLSIVLLVFFTLIGFLYHPLKQMKAGLNFRVLLLLYSSLTFISLYLVDWPSIQMSSERTRVVEFAFFPIAIFSALGIILCLKKIAKTASYKYLEKHHVLHSCVRVLLISAFVCIFVPPTIFNAFSRGMYEPNYSPYISDEDFVTPEQQCALGYWTFLYIKSNEETTFAGSLGADRYVLGYGLFQGKWALEMFNLTSNEDLTVAENVFYVVNKYNLELPDHSGKKLNQPTIRLLSDSFDRIYDTGDIELYYKYI